MEKGLTIGRIFGMSEFTHEILPPNLAVKAMRSSGFRDSAHAVAELIDNSIQAGLKDNQCTEVEVICVDKVDLVSKRTRQRIHKIGVYDNACGMNAETLRLALQFGNGTHLTPKEQDGIGKFGMGLPNSSISQCRRVDVWSWKDGSCSHSYLDIDEIAEGRMRIVPEPKEDKFPEYWKKLLSHEIGASGTLVVWSNLDRIRWKTSQAFLRNAESLIGRMYRYFIKDNKAQIQLSCFLENGGTLENVNTQYARANDPLYLMTDTSTPSPFDSEPAFEEASDIPISVAIDGEEHEVRLKFSFTKLEARAAGGSQPIGKHAGKNQGVSVVRAGRELEMNRTFENTYDPLERWWGVEVSFQPELDDVFGVTNNKQAATAFGSMDLDDDAKNEGMTPQAYREVLAGEGDPRLLIYELSHQIKTTLSTIRGQIKRMKEKVGVGTQDPSSSEAIATEATNRRREQGGDKGKSDEEEKHDDEKRRRELEDELIGEGLPKEQAKEIAIEYVRRNIKYLFQEAEISSPAIFDVRSKAGTIIVLINSKHPASKDLFELLEKEGADEGSESRELQALKLLLMAWARMEDEAGETLRERLTDIRIDWGRLAREFLNVADE